MSWISDKLKKMFSGWVAEEPPWNPFHHLLGSVASWSKDEGEALALFLVPKLADPELIPIEPGAAEDADMFCAYGDLTLIGYRSAFFKKTATPVLKAWRHAREGYTERGYGAARQELKNCRDPVWRDACLGWLDREECAWKKKNSRA
jgi:hypothetical protein